MKYLKMYEGLNKPQVGDYVAVRDDTDDTSTDRIIFDNFLSNNVGQVVKILDEKKSNFPYYITFDNLQDQPEGIIHYFSSETYSRDFELSEILYFDGDKENVELWIQANKYNI